MNPLSEVYRNPLIPEGDFWVRLAGIDYLIQKPTDVADGWVATLIIERLHPEQRGTTLRVAVHGTKNATAFRQSFRDGLILIDGSIPFAAFLRVIRQGKLQLVSDAEVIHNQATRLIFENTVDPSDSLHKSMPSHGLVDVMGVHWRAIKSRQPHVANNHQLQAVLRVFESFGNGFPSGLISSVTCDPWPFAGVPGHDDLDGESLAVAEPPNNFGQELMRERWTVSDWYGRRIKIQGSDTSDSRRHTRSLFTS